MNLDDFDRILTSHYAVLMRWQICTTPEEHREQGLRDEAVIGRIYRTHRAEGWMPRFRLVRWWPDR